MHGSVELQASLFELFGESSHYLKALDNESAKILVVEEES